MKNKLLFTGIFLTIIALAACAAPAAVTTTSAPAPTPNAPATTAPTVTTTAPAASGAAKPQGDLIAAVSDLGNENFLPWIATFNAFDMLLLVYDNLIYYEETTGKFIPGLAEKWEVSPDGKTITFSLRKGIQWHDGYGEVTAADIKYNFEQHGSSTSQSSKLAVVRQIASMETPDPYKLVVNLKAADPAFWQKWSYGAGGISQGMVCKKYVESVGVDVAAKKPVGSGPYKLVDSKVGDHYTFEAYDENWRVVPEFKNLTLRIVPELSTQVAMLKTGEIDLAPISSELIPELKAAGLATEVSPVGGAIIVLGFGGMFSTEDSRYKAGYHMQDPWTDIRVRQAMNIAIDRKAITQAIYAGGATPAGSPLITPDSDKYQFPYDPVKAKQLLVEAGYPNGFKFNLYSYVLSGRPETPRLIEALASYWLKIGLSPKIVSSDLNVYIAGHFRTAQNAGEIAPFKHSASSDVLSMVFSSYIPGASNPMYNDAQTNALYKAASVLVNPDERAAATDKVLKYLFDNYAPIPVVRVAYSFAWNPKKVAPFPYSLMAIPFYLEYVRHAQPLNTFRLFTPWAGR